MTGHVLAVRQDNDGDVLLTGPALRALAAGAGRLTVLCGPRGAQAARLLPGVDEVLVHRAEWIDPEPPPVDRAATLALVERLSGLRVDRAVVFTSFHQSPLPTALLLRLAGVPWIAAISEDYPGSLLDVRHRGVDDDLHEVQRALSLAAAADAHLPAGDDGRLAVRPPPDVRALVPAGPYVVVHPGTSVPARAWSPANHRDLVAALAASNRTVVVTGAPSETALTAFVSAGACAGAGAPPAVAGSPAADGPPRPGGHGRAVDLGGRTSLAELAGVLAAAEAVVVGNTGPAHLAAAVGVPVVSLFAPTVPAVRWRPWGVPLRLLNTPVLCAGCRARHCPVPGHPCLDGPDGVAPSRVLEALADLLQPARVRASA